MRTNNEFTNSQQIVTCEKGYQTKRDTYLLSSHDCNNAEGGYKLSTDHRATWMVEKRIPVCTI